MPGRVADEDRWEARAARARRLRPERPAAAEALDFYARLAAVQGSLLRRHADVVVRSPRSSLPDDFARGIHLDALLPAGSDLLAWMRREAPPPVSRAAETLRECSAAGWRRLIGRYLETHNRCGRPSAPPNGTTRPPNAASDPPGAVECMSDAPFDEPTIFLAEALLQPFAEAVAAASLPAPPPGAATRCPACAGLPVVGALREKGHGAERLLVCGLCFTEWPALRLVCLSCGEERFDRLPVFRDEAGGVERVDACESCRVYVKTIDLTRDGGAVAVVDDLASLALDLWARGEGYARLRPNLLRL